MKLFIDRKGWIWYYIQALDETARQGTRSLKTKQETSISTNIITDIGITKKQNQNALAFELNQMESLILAQDERWRHA